MSFRRTGAIAVILSLAIGVSGCASGARPTAMVAPLQAETMLPEDSPLHQAVVVGAITGGEETNPMWTSEVSNAAFRQALESSLDLATIKSPSADAPLVVDATLVSVDQPLMGFSITVTSTAEYAVKALDGEEIWRTTVVAPYTAKMSDAFLGYERLRLANEGSIKANISSFVSQLVAESQKTPNPFAPAVPGAVSGPAVAAAQ